MKAEIVKLGSKHTKKVAPALGRIHELLNAIIVVNKEGVIIDINDYVLQTPHQKPRQKSLFIGKKIFDLHGIQQHPALVEKISELLMGEGFSTLDVHGTMPDARQDYWLRCFGAYYGGYSIIGFEDILEQKQIETESFAAIQRFQSLFDNHPDATFCFDVSGNILSVNSNSARLSGYPADELIGHNFTKFFHRHSWDAIVENGRKALKGQPANFEVTLIRKDGVQVIVAVTLIPIAQKSRSDGFYGIARDITENRRLLNLIQEIKDEYEDVFEHSPMAIFAIEIHDGNFVITRMNRKAEELYGYAHEEITGQSGDRIFDKKDLERLRQHLADAKSSGGVSFETAHRRKNGERFEALVSINASQQVAKRLVMSVEDLTFERQMEAAKTNLIRELKESHATLERKSKLQELVLRVLGHDFRSPFNSILGGTKLLMELGLTTEQQELVDIIHRSAKHELKLIDNLLKFSQIEEGDIQFNIEHVSSHVIAHEVRKQFYDLANSKKVDVVFGRVDAVYFAVDPDVVFRNVISNLIHNAIKYSYPGQKVHVEIIKKSKKVGMMKVTDSGIGIPDDILKKVFEITPVKNRIGTHKEKSTGFGLYIANQMTKLMGGKIKMTSKVNEGTTAILELPILSNHKGQPAKPYNPYEESPTDH